MYKSSSKQSDDSVFLMVGVIILAIFWRIRSALYRHLMIVEIVFSLLLVLGPISYKLIAGNKKTINTSNWNSISGLAFEDQVSEWLRLNGYIDIIKTEYFDQGIDIIASKSGILLGVQTKRSARPVGVAAVRAAVAGLKAYGCNQGMVVTNSSFTRAAIKLALSNGCQLVDGQKLKSSTAQLSNS